MKGNEGSQSRSETISPNLHYRITRGQLWQDHCPRSLPLVLAGQEVAMQQWLESHCSHDSHANSPELERSSPQHPGGSSQLLELQCQGVWRLLPASLDDAYHGTHTDTHIHKNICKIRYKSWINLKKKTRHLFSLPFWTSKIAKGIKEIIASWCRNKCLH